MIKPIYQADHELLLHPDRLLFKYLHRFGLSIPHS